LTKESLRDLYIKLGLAIYVLIVITVITMIQPSLILWQHDINDNTPIDQRILYEMVNGISYQAWYARVTIRFFILIALFSLLGYIVLIIALIVIEKKKLKRERGDIQQPQKRTVLKKSLEYCPSCGAELLDKSGEFCSKCGATIK